MKKKFLTIYIVFTSLLIVSCSSTKQVTQKDDGKINFTFLQLNDVYEISPIQGGEFGGLERVETVHKKLLKENKNTMLFMAGDFLNPSLIGTMKHKGNRIKGKQVIEVMNAMNFELVSFGNHEFDLNKNDLQKRLNESNFNWISANVRQKVCRETYPFYQLKNNIKHFVHDTYIKELVDADGTRIKIGFVSVCISSNPKNYVIYKDIYKEAKRAYQTLKNKVDVVFGLTHLSISQDKKIARLLPNIPLIMGGHEHTNMSVTVGSSKITKADANAKTIYIHRIFYDTKTKKINIKSELKEINKTIPSDKKVKTIVSKWQTILQSEITNVVNNPNEIIYTAITPLDARDTPIRSKQTNMGKIITKAMSFAYQNKVDCALVNGGSIRIDDVLKGNISALDIFRVLPYGGSVLKVDLKGNLLQKVLAYGEKSSGTGAYLQRYNVQKKDEVWYVNNQPIKPNKIYAVAFSDYLLKGYDIPFLNKKNKEVITIYYPQKNELAYDIRKAIILFLKK